MIAPDVIGDGVRGSCPSLHEPMAALDGLIVRVKPYVRGLSAADLYVLANTAEASGATQLALTRRVALQVRGLDAAGAAAFARAMVQAGLASPDPGVERRRNLQLATACGASLRDLAAALERWLDQDAGLAPLPAKFGYAVTPGERLEADIVVLGEDAGAILIGGDIAVRADPTPLAAVQRLTHAFLVLASRQPTPPRRMKALVQAVGATEFLLEARVEPVVLPPRGEAGGAGMMGRVGAGQGGFGLGVVFGALTPAMLRAAAAMADRYGEGVVALAPGRVVWVWGVSPTAHARLMAEATRAGFIADPGDRRLRLDACIGRAGCARAAEDVRGDALRLAWAAPARGLHVSGCAKGCARPGAAGVTLVSRGIALGAKGRYDLILDGAPSASPAFADLTLDQIADHLRPPPTP